MKTSRHLILGAAVAGLVTGGALFTLSTPSFAKDKVDCYNSCKGKGACKSEANSCKGKNACAGQGKVRKMSAAACAKAKGTTTPPAAASGGAAAPTTPAAGGQQ